MRKIYSAFIPNKDQGQSIPTVWDWQERGDGRKSVSYDFRANEGSCTYLKMSMRTFSYALKQINAHRSKEN